MRLLKCYINGYGCLVDKEIIFSQLHEGLEENGKGKTTLCHFLKSMFYGLVKDKNKVDERELYRPFDSNVFGGSVEVNYQNSIYKIERTFGKKAKDDICKVYKDNKEIEINEVLGVKFFGIDEESFIRTIFINAEDLSISTTEEMRSKISGFISKTDVSFDMNTVEKKIDKRMKEIKSRKKGLYYDCENDIKDKTNQIENLNHIALALKDKYEKYNKLNSELEVKQERSKRASKENLRIQSWQEKLSKESKINSKISEMNDIEKVYGSLLINQDEVSKIKELDKKYNECKRDLEKLVLSNEDLYSYDILSKKFANELDEVKLKENEELLKEFEKIQDRTYEISEKEDLIYKKYLNANIDFEALDNELNKLKNLEEPQYANIKIEAPKKSKFMWLQIVGGIILVLGVILGIINPALFSIGFVGLILVLLPFIISKPQPIKENQENLEKINLINSINLKTAPFGFSVDKMSYEIASYSLKEEYNKFKEIKEKLKKQNEEKEIDSKRKEEINSILDSYFISYGYSGNYSNNFILIRQDYNKYQMIKKSFLEKEDKRNKTNEEISKMNDLIDEFIKTYSITKNLSEFFLEYDRDLNRYIYLKNDIVKLEKELEVYIKTNNITTEPEEEIVDVDDLNEEINKLIGEVKQIQSEIEEDEDYLSELDLLKDEVKELEEKKTSLDREYRILETTLNSLKKAKDNLNQKYIDPMANRIKEYSKLLNFSYGENPKLDSNFDFMYEDRGTNRNYINLSQGQLTMAALSYRLALIDNIFDESQFIIIDDAFVNLDEANLAYTLKLVKALSQKHQILYFSCHKSRQIV